MPSDPNNISDIKGRNEDLIPDIDDDADDLQNFQPIIIGKRSLSEIAKLSITIAEDLSS